MVGTATSAIERTGFAINGDGLRLSAIKLFSRTFTDRHATLVSDLDVVRGVLVRTEAWRDKAARIAAEREQMYADLQAARDEEEQWAMLHAAQVAQCSDLRAARMSKDALRGEHARRHHAMLDGWQRRLAKLLREERMAIVELRATRPVDWVTFAAVLRAEIVHHAEGATTDASIGTSSAAVGSRNRLELLAEALLALLPSLAQPEDDGDNWLLPGPAPSMAAAAPAMSAPSAPGAASMPHQEGHMGTAPWAGGVFSKRVAKPPSSAPSSGRAPASARPSLSTSRPQTAAAPLVAQPPTAPPLTARPPSRPPTSSARIRWLRGSVR